MRTALQLTLLALPLLGGCVDGVLFGPPVVELVAIMPGPAHAGDTLRCQTQGFLGGENESLYEWAINGEFAGMEQTLEEGFVKGDEVSCTVTPSNGKRNGEPLSVTIEIVNAPAEVANVSLSPDPADSADTLSCHHDDATDADEDATFTYHYAWTIDGERNQVTSATLNPNKVERDATIQCHVTANDGEEDGPEQPSQEVVINNSPPSIPAAILEPFAPTEDDIITCDYLSFNDADGDSDQSSFHWTINGVDAGTSDTLTGGFENGDTLVCTITPFDGFDEGEPVSATALVADPVDCSVSGDGYWSAGWASIECEVLDETNYRRSLGADCGTEGVWPSAGPLTMNANLRYAARIHTDWMASVDDLSHDSPGGPIGDDLSERVDASGYNWVAIAENIAAGYSSPQDVLDGWMSSDGHCRNIMNSNYDEIGIGYVYDSSTTYDHWWTQDFGRQ
jgi:uncharacterized protein YkwD